MPLFLIDSWEFGTDHYFPVTYFNPGCVLETTNSSYKVYVILGNLRDNYSMFMISK